MKYRILPAILLTLICSGCAKHLKVPFDDTRASLNPSFYTETSATSKGVPEDSASTRATVLEAIKRDMLKTGRYPKSAIQAAELLTLNAVAPNQITGNSYWNYRALVRINLDTTSHDVEFMAFELNDEIIVRKISVY